MPLALLCGRLFSADPVSVCRAPRCPVREAHGTRGDCRDFSGAGRARARGNGTVAAYDAGALVHYQHPDAGVAAWRRFLAGSAAAR